MSRTALASLGAVTLALAVGLPPRPALARTPAAALAMTEASESSRVGVLPVQVKGDLPTSAADDMRTILVDNLAAEGVEVLATEAVDEALVSAGPCDDAECRAELAAGLGADYLVAARVEGDEDEFTTTAVLVDAQTGDEVAPFTGECTICGFVEVRDLMRMRALDARAEVIRRAGADAAPPPVVEGPVDAPPPPSKLVAPGWALVGAGATATLGGIVLLALHERSAGCQDNPRGGECIPLRYTTAPLGGAVLGVGILAAAGGVVMLVLDRKARAEPPRSQVSLSPRGVSWRLRF